MRFKLIVLAILALMLIIASQNVLADSELNATANAFASNITSAAAIEFASVDGIWKISLAETEITMELNESGEFITGRCKYEGDEPWNGVLAGSILGNAISMAMSGLEDKLLVATEITGTISKDDL